MRGAEIEPANPREEGARPAAPFDRIEEVERADAGALGILWTIPDEQAKMGRVDFSRVLRGQAEARFDHQSGRGLSAPTASHFGVAGARVVAAEGDAIEERVALPVSLDHRRQDRMEVHNPECNAALIRDADHSAPALLPGPDGRESLGENADVFGAVDETAQRIVNALANRAVQVQPQDRNSFFSHAYQFFSFH